MYWFKWFLRGNFYSNWIVLFQIWDVSHSSNSLHVELSGDNQNHYYFSPKIKRSTWIMWQIGQVSLWWSGTKHSSFNRTWKEYLLYSKELICSSWHYQVFEPFSDGNAIWSLFSDVWWYSMYFLLLPYSLIYQGQPYNQIA